MALEYIESVDSIFSRKFEEDEISMGVCSSGIITPDDIKYAMNVDSPRGRYLGDHSKTHRIMMQRLFGRNKVDTSLFYRIIRVTLRLEYDYDIRGWRKQAIYETPKILVPNELAELSSGIRKLQQKNVEIGGIVYDVDPRDDSEKVLSNARNKETLRYGRKYNESDDINNMIHLLRSNLVLEGYSLPGIYTKKIEGEER